MLPGLAPSDLNGGVTAEALARVAQALASAPLALREQAWSQALSTLPAPRTRAALLSAGLAPLALSLDRRATLAAAACPMLGVLARWP